MLTPEQWVRRVRRQSASRAPDVRVPRRAWRSRRAAERSSTAFARRIRRSTFQKRCGESVAHAVRGDALRVAPSSGASIPACCISRASAGLRCVSYWGPTDPGDAAARELGRRRTAALSQDRLLPVRAHERSAAVSRRQSVHQGSVRATRTCHRLDWTPMEYPPQRTAYRGASRKILTRGAGSNIGFICVAVMLVYCVVHAFDPPRLNWGDSAIGLQRDDLGAQLSRSTDSCKLRLTPFVLDPAYMTDADRRLVYTHYPQLPDLMNGLERTLLRIHGPRAIPAGGARVLVQRAVLRLPARRLLLVAPGGAARARAVGHQSALDSARRLSASRAVRGVLRVRGAVFPLPGSERGTPGIPGRVGRVRLSRVHRVVRLLVLRAAVVGDDDVRPLPEGRSARRSGCSGSLAACAVAALLAKWATNAWALGGVAAFIRDLRFQMVERATNQAVRSGVRPGHRSDADWPRRAVVHACSSSRSPRFGRSTRCCGVASRCRATRDARP